VNIRPYSTEYAECQAFCPFVGIGSPHPLNRKRVLLPPFGFKGGDTLACGGGGWGDPIQTRGHIHCGTIGIYVLCAWHPIEVLFTEQQRGG
jgi:hypothetical protein